LVKRGGKPIDKPRITPDGRAGIDYKRGVGGQVRHLRRGV
jgi:hypothetical protein